MSNWLDIDNSVVVITGGSSGIGSVIVETLLANGAIVYNVDLKMVRKITEIIIFEVDVTDKHRVQEVVSLIFNQEQKIDVLINNAGVNLPRVLADTQDTHPEYEINERDLDFMFNVNLKGPIWFSQAVAKYFIKQRKGKIINISSEAGQEGSEGQSLYSATKAALIGLTRSWAKELGKYNINVTAIAPGIIEETGLRTPEYESALAYSRNITVDQLNGIILNPYL